MKDLVSAVAESFKGFIFGGTNPSDQLQSRELLRDPKSSSLRSIEASLFANMVYQMSSRRLCMPSSSIPSPLFRLCFKAGNVLSIDTETYSYDALNRLIHSSGPWGWSNYTYDSAGNMVSQVHKGGSTGRPVHLSTRTRGSFTGVP
jgi:YD repeat-containing protein